MPRDQRLLKICEAILRDPAARTSLQEWEQTVGASRRTITRLFPAETQLSFDEWRKQAVLLEALRRLAAGQSVSQVAPELNCDSCSAFGVGCDARGLHRRTAARAVGQRALDRGEGRHGALSQPSRRSALNGARPRTCPRRAACAPPARPRH